MRRLLVMLCAACAGEAPVDDSCKTEIVSDHWHEPRHIISGDQLIGITWARQSLNANEIHAAIVGADGTLGPDIWLPDPFPRGAAGSATVLWSGSEPCKTPHAFAVTLQRGGDVAYFDIAPDATADDVVFDGQRYQLFWIAGGMLAQRSLDEDGTLGPVRELGPATGCVYAAADRAGTSFARDEQNGYLVDASGSRKVLSGAMLGNGDTFFFAGQFHVYRLTNLISVLPTGASTTRLLELAVGLGEFYPGATRLFATTSSRLLELDADFEPIGEHALQGHMGTLDDDLVAFDHTMIDQIARIPGHLELVRGDQWRIGLAVDSPVRDAVFCAQRE